MLSSAPYISERLSFALDLPNQFLIQKGITIANFELRSGSQSVGIEWNNLSHIGKFDGSFRDIAYVEVYLDAHTTTDFKKQLRIQYTNTPADLESWGNDQIVFFRMDEYNAKFIPILGEKDRYMRFIFDIGDYSPNQEDIFSGRIDSRLYEPQNADDAIGAYRQPTAIASPSVESESGITDNYSWSITLNADPDGLPPGRVHVVLYKVVNGIETQLQSKDITTGLELGAVVDVLFENLLGIEDGHAVSYVIDAIALEA